ncbi:hypothetical protein ACP6EK_03725 [Candidatus Caldatribacterium sp. SIUC1]|uniref:hypothetical protein n=1 Tax=Candidatus Caldatribacterium sp. SIUC1 TaxID=3418365 RepID=UPI003F69084E
MQSGKPKPKITPAVKREIIQIVDERIRETYGGTEGFVELRDTLKDLGTIVGELVKVEKRREEDFTRLIGHVEKLTEAQKRTEERIEALAEAQRRTEERVDKLTETVEALTEAQKRTEERIEALAEAQRRTEERVDKLTETVEALTEAQKRTEERIEALAEAQRRTEERVDKLTETVEALTEAQKRTEEEIRNLTAGLKRTREELGGLSRSFSYAFENEAYRMLPRVLQEKYGFRVTERFVRIDIGGVEVNFFGKGEREGKPVYFVGEAKIRLDDGKERVFQELEQKAKAVQKEYEATGIVKILVTHFATRGFLRKAAEKGVIVIQSYEW